jgi:biopolymer transport protein ExbD/biopolymer transport protein TolR
MLNLQGSSGGLPIAFQHEEGLFMSMSTGSGSGSLQSDINVTPMVDIMLVLLIIFMVVTPLLQSGVNVVLPKGQNPEEDANITKDTAVVVAIPMEGAYYVGRDIVQGKDRLIATIKSRMDALKPSDPHVVYIKGGTSVNYGEVVEVVNAIREAGFDQIGLVVDKKKDSDK